MTNDQIPMTNEFMVNCRIWSLVLGHWSLPVGSSFRCGEKLMTALTEDLREKIRAEFPKYPTKQAVTLPALHIVHDAHRAVSTEAMVEIAELLELHPAEVSDTMTFYGFFREADSPAGAKRVWVCRSISCMLRG